MMRSLPSAALRCAFVPLSATKCPQSSDPFRTEPRRVCVWSAPLNPPPTPPPPPPHPRLRPPFCGNGAVTNLSALNWAQCVKQRRRQQRETAESRRLWRSSAGRLQSEHANQHTRITFCNIFWTLNHQQNQDFPFFSPSDHLILRRGCRGRRRDSAQDAGD